MENSLVSIIIPTYNRAQLIAETLDSVLAQTYTNWECIVVDDGSTDDTDEVLKTYCDKDARFKYYLRPDTYKPGGNGARNYGFELSKGEYILFLDSDDLLKNTCLEKRCELFYKNCELDFVIANTSYYSNAKFSSEAICEFPEGTEPDTYLNHFLRYQITWTIMGVLWKKKSIKDIGYDEDLKRFQDVDFHINILMNKILSCFRINEVDTYYRLDEKKEPSIVFINNMFKAFYVFFNKYELLLKKEAYKSSFKVFNAIILTQFVTPYFKGNEKESNTLLKNALRSKLFGTKQKWYIFLLFLFLNLNLINYKNIGMNQFKKQLNKVLRR